MNKQRKGKLIIRHKRSYKEFKVMGISHGYRIKPLCMVDPEPNWSKKRFQYWDGFAYTFENMKCKRCINLMAKGKSLKERAS
tara:strand:+ start:732 stop:977 length:246 start_codon:yes stop_codon:yes gene_type:complete